ncbi:MAG: hypothetical protein RR630_03560 [Coprobacillus sp.]
MKLNECIKKLNDKEECIVLVNQNECLQDIEGVYIGDLLSHVMANGKEGALWLTVQRHVNVIAVAELNEFSAVIFVEGVVPEEDTIHKANELDIPLLKTNLDAFLLIKELISIGL